MHDVRVDWVHLRCSTQFTQRWLNYKLYTRFNSVRSLIYFGSRKKRQSRKKPLYDRDAISFIFVNGAESVRMPLWLWKIDCHAKKQKSEKKNEKKNSQREIMNKLIWMINAYAFKYRWWRRPKFCFNIWLAYLFTVHSKSTAKKHDAKNFHQRQRSIAPLPSVCCVLCFHYTYTKVRGAEWFYSRNTMIETIYLPIFQDVLLGGLHRFWYGISYK